MYNKKYRHIISAGAKTISSNPIKYTYGQTRVVMYLSSKGFRIVYDRPKVENLLEEDIVRDALRKAQLIYAIKYSKEFKFNRIDALVDYETICLYEANNGNEQLIFTMFAGKLTKQMSFLWHNTNILESIANTAKSNYDRRYAALFALIMAKSKIFETERFIYLWMSMNALYGYIASIYKDTIRKEVKQHELMASVYDLNYCSGPKDSKSKIRNKAMEFLEELTEKEKAELLANIMNNNWNEGRLCDIKGLIDAYFKNKQIDPLAFFLIWLPYQIRCKYYHGEKAIPILSFFDERPIPTLRFLNELIERFLDDKLVRWFDNEVVSTKLLPKLNLI